jgi:hypothetical protein
MSVAVSSAELLQTGVAQLSDLSSQAMLLTPTSVADHLTQLDNVSCTSMSARQYFERAKALHFCQLYRDLNLHSQNKSRVKNAKEYFAHHQSGTSALNSTRIEVLMWHMAVCEARQVLLKARCAPYSPSYDELIDFSLRMQRNVECALHEVMPVVFGLSSTTLQAFKALDAAWQIDAEALDDAVSTLCEPQRPTHVSLKMLRLVDLFDTVRMTRKKLTIDGLTSKKNIMIDDWVRAVKPLYGDVAYDVAALEKRSRTVWEEMWMRSCRAWDAAASTLGNGRAEKELGHLPNNDQCGNDDQGSQDDDHRPSKRSRVVVADLEDLQRPIRRQGTEVSQQNKTL